MRAKDLVVDGEYYLHSSNAWADRSRRGDRAVVVDARPGHYIRNREGAWERSPRGNGQDVLVRVFEWRGPEDPRGERGKGRIEPVRTQDLRGPWGATLEHHETLIKRRREAEAAARAAQTERLRVCGEAEIALEGLGIHADIDGWTHGNAASVKVPATHAALLAAAARHLLATGWRPSTV